MCGICVWVTRDRAVRPDRLAEAIELLRHRGPDGRNLYLLEHTAEGPRDCVIDLDRADAPIAPCHVGLGHTRLVIIDPSESSNQPFVSDSGNHILVYNGEIYDFVEQREKLRDRGHEFRSTGDTEVLSLLLQSEGLSALRRLNGMWALAFLSKRTNELLLSRDRYGKKPLFFYRDAEQFIAASEMKSIYSILRTSRTINSDYLAGFALTYMWPTFDDGATLYREIHALPAGSSAVLNLDTLAFEISADNPVEALLHATPHPTTLAADLRSSVAYRLRADVPVAITVSGGVDSAAIAAFALEVAARPKKIAFYTVNTARHESGNERDDLHYSKILAESLGCDLRVVELPQLEDTATLLEGWRHLTRQYELPLNPFLVSYPGFLLFRQMSADGIRVVLDGTGGDEIMGGYPRVWSEQVARHVNNRHVIRALLQYWRSLRYSPRSPGEAIRGSLRYCKRGIVGPPILHHVDTAFELLIKYGRQSVSDNAQATRLSIQAGVFAGSSRESQVYDLLRGGIPYYNYVNDQNAMANSIEVRSPFLDYRLAKYVQLPERCKWRRGFNKYQLRRSLPPRVPREIRWRRSKQGFGSAPGPILRQLDSTIRSSVGDSQVLRDLFDIPELLKAYERSGTAGPAVGNLVRQLFFLSLVEREYSLTCS